jgi:peptidase E
MTKSIALIGLLVISVSAGAEIYVTTDKTEKSVTLWAQHPTNFYDGNQLYQYCTSDNSVEGGLCLGYITGVADVLQNQNGNNICLPKNAVINQIVDTVKKYLTNNPESRHYSAYSEISVALGTAFPCK